MKLGWFIIDFYKMITTTNAWNFCKQTERVIVLYMIRFVHYLHVIRRIIRYSASILLSDSNAWRTCLFIRSGEANELGQVGGNKQSTDKLKNFTTSRAHSRNVVHQNSTALHLRRSIEYYSNSRSVNRRTNPEEENVTDSIKVNHDDRTKIRHTTTTTTNLPLFCFLLFSLSLKCAITACNAFSIKDVINGSGKRTAGINTIICPTWHPFQCPNGDCIPIKYLCDGSPDCTDEYDEDKRMCTAAVRPPVEETAAFIRALLSAHGSNFLVKLFGEKAKDKMRAMGGVDKVAVAISQSPTIEAFGAEMRLKPSEVERLTEVLESIISGATSELTYDEAGDFRFFVEKLQETGFF